jgi:hypothetical protein
MTTCKTPPPDLMEHLHHLNGYESYDPTGVIVTIKNNGQHGYSWSGPRARIVLNIEH